MAYSKENQETDLGTDSVKTDKTNITSKPDLR